MKQPIWLHKPEDHDYTAAGDYLDLLLEEEKVDILVGLLCSGDLTKKKAKDILRASELSLLPADDPHVAHDLKKIHESTALSPVLLVRANPLVIADGYHRVCACYHLEPNTEVHCKLV